VSVVVPLYQAKSYYTRLATSLAPQEAGEIIAVVDDGSPPAQVEALLSEIPKLRVLTTSGGIGTAAARNLGAEKATQEWITFLDQDDWWDPGFLHQLLGVSNHGIVAYNNYLWQEDGEEVVPMNETVFEHARWTRTRVGPEESALLLDGFPMLKLLLKRKSFLSVGGYRDIYAVEDFDLVWRLIASGRYIDLVDTPAGNYTLHAHSTTSQVGRDRLAYERAQRSWLRIWSDMARTGSLPAQVRRECARKSISVAARMAARRVRTALLPARP
jgi:glycosyltransferase involved in cell wall biosynthesis